MSVASSSSFTCIKFPNRSVLQSPSPPPPSSSSSSYTFMRFSVSKPGTPALNIRNSQAEGPFRRPVAPSPPTPVKPVPPSASPPPPSAPPKPAAVEDKSASAITLEFQRQKAKELQEYFKQKKLDDANQGPFFGFIGKNEISNGRWAMFGFAVGMLTEYATGSDFVDQVKILLSNFGILDLE
nr:light-harvesting complex-like protein OHP2, chloroplastic [Ipomoea batatas]